jgi:hypothetical protein
MNAQLGTDLAHGPVQGVQVGRTLNVHGCHGNDSQPVHLARSSFAPKIGDAGEQ